MILISYEEIVTYKVVTQLRNIYPKNSVETEIISFEIDTQYSECLASPVVSVHPDGTYTKGDLTVRHI